MSNEVVWHYFDVTKDADGKSSVVCSICNVCLVFDHRNLTAIMRRHMERKHYMELKLAYYQEARMSAQKPGLKVVVKEEGGTMGSPASSGGKGLLKEGDAMGSLTLSGGKCLLKEGSAVVSSPDLSGGKGLVKEESAAMGLSPSSGSKCLPKEGTAMGSPTLSGGKSLLKEESTTKGLPASSGDKDLLKEEGNTVCLPLITRGKGLLKESGKVVLPFVAGGKSLLKEASTTVGLASVTKSCAGLTGADDRGSSEFSQNEDETTGNASPEHFLGETSEREPTPAPVVQTPPKPESYQLRHNNHLTIVLEALARDEAFMDVTLTAQGRSLKAHKSVLSAVSPYFRGVLRDNPCQHPIIIMPRDVRFEELFSIVNYIYKGEMTVAAEDLTSLLKTAEILQVSGLAPSDSTATVNPHNIRSSSASSSSSSSNIPHISKVSKTIKEPNRGISAPVARAKSPENMINPSDFMDMDMTYVKEEVESGGEEEPAAASEMTSTPSTQQPEQIASPKTNDTQQQESMTFSSMYNQNQEQTMTPTSGSSHETSNNVPVKSETEADGRQDTDQLQNGTENPQPFVCPHCQGQHRGIENMNSHLRLNHPTKPSFPCLCGRVFIRSMSHQIHIKTCSTASS